MQTQTQTVEQLTAERNKLTPSQRASLRRMFGGSGVTALHVEPQSIATRVDFTAAGVRRIVYLGKRGANRGVELVSVA